MRRVLGIILICSVFIGLISCEKNNNETKDDGYLLQSDKYEENNIKIKYPKLSGFKDKEKEDRLNNIIKDNAISIADKYGQDKNTVDLEIEYVVKYKDDDKLSIAYSGLGITEAPHYPVHHFYTTNIDVKNEKLLNLADLTNVNIDLAEKLKYNDFQLKNKQQSGVLNKIDVNKILDSLQNSDDINKMEAYSQNECFSYITDTKLGISIPVDHKEGDHAEFEIELKEL